MPEGQAKPRCPVRVALWLLGTAFLVFSTPGAATATTVEKRIAVSADDAEEFANGSVHLNSKSLELIHDSSDQTVGLRWTGLAIPQGATITAAYIQFSARESQSEVTSLTFGAQAADNAATFSSGSGNISTRARTTASAGWAPVAWTAGQVGANQRTPDLAALVQEIVSRPGWASGNALVVIVTGTGHRTAWPFDGLAEQAPLLHVEFSGPPPPDSPPVARLSVSQAVSPPLTVNADGSASTDTDATPIASYRFDFGDGTSAVTTTAPTATAQHTYATTGTYTVTLTATDTGSLTSTPTSVSITVNRSRPVDFPPIAALSVTQLASPPLTVNADGSASTDTDITPIASYRFDFGDGTSPVTTTAPTATAQHIYATAGTYTVTLTVTDTGNLTSTPKSVSITVNPPPPVDNPPIAALSVAQLASPSLTVNADGSASTDTDATPIASYRFDFGDGTSPVTTTAPTATAQHVYAVAGPYTVTLTVTDTGNLTSAPGSVSITVTPPAGGGTSVDVRVAASTDDGEESATGSMSRSSSDLELIHDTSDQTVGMRWAGLAIPQGATITAAYVQFAANESQSEVTSLTLRGEAADNAVTFASGTGNISTRPRTAASAIWNLVAWATGEAGANQRTPDLSAVVQEIVSRPGWVSGNALVVIVTGTGHRTAWAYDGNTSLAPLLHVEFGGVPPGNQAPNGTIDSPTSNVTITAGQSVNFQGTGSDPDANLPLAYFWDLGGGAGDQAIEDPGPVVFSTPGSYTARFIVTDASGLADPTPDARTITVNGPGTVAVDEVHWTIMGQTAVTFDWRGSANTIRYGLTTAYGSTATAQTPSPLPFSSAGPFWEARLTGLQENTLYHYSIGAGPDHTFRTPIPRGSSDFTIYAEGDIRNATSSPRMGVIQSMIAAGHPNFVLTLGDLTYASPSGQALVDRHFNDIMVWSQDAADMPIWGNHEWTAPTEDDLRNYKGRFDLPNAQTSPGSPAVSCCGEDWYWFDYGNVRFIGYPEQWSGAWSDWGTRVAPIMAQAQGDPAIRYIVTFGHKPAYSSGNHSGSTELRTIMDAMGANYSKYVLNLNGHSHNYERSYPQFGVVHITSGTGGANLEQSSPPCLWPGGCPPPAWSAYRAMHHIALKLRFTATGIEGTAFCGPPGDTGSNQNDVVCTQGAVLDSFFIGLGTMVAQRDRVAKPVPASTPVEIDADGLAAGGVARAWVTPSPLREGGVLHFVNTWPGPVTVTLFDVRGSIVRELVTGQVLRPGLHQVELDGRDDRGNPIRSGVYLYQVSMPDQVIGGKLLVVR